MPLTVFTNLYQVNAYYLQNLAAAQRVQQAAPSNVNNRFEQTQEPPKPVHTPTTAPPIEEPNTQKQSPLEASSLIPPQSPMNSLPPPSSDNMAMAETAQAPAMQAQPPVVNPPAPPPPPDNNNPVQPQQPPTVSSQPNLALTTQQIHQQLLHQVGCKMSKYVSRTHLSIFTGLLWLCSIFYFFL